MNWVWFGLELDKKQQFAFLVGPELDNKMYMFKGFKSNKK